MTLAQMVAHLQLMGMQGALQHGRLLHLPALAVESQRTPLCLVLLQRFCRPCAADIVHCQKASAAAHAMR